MARKNDTPQKVAMRKMMSSYLKQNDVKIKDGTDINAIMRDMMSVILEGALDEDYRNKESWGGRYLDCLCGRPFRLSTSNRSRIPTGRNSIMYHPSNPEFHKVRILQRNQATDGGFEKVYAAPTEEAAWLTLDSFGEKWDVKYPKIKKSWRDN